MQSDIPLNSQGYTQFLADTNKHSYIYRTGVRRFPKEKTRSSAIHFFIYTETPRIQAITRQYL